MAVGHLSDALHTSLKEYDLVYNVRWLFNVDTASFLVLPKYSDLIVRCEGRDFKVHKVIVCGQSEFFSTICDGDWKETADSIIELKEDSVRAIEAMIYFMYTFDYDGSGINKERASPMIFNVEVYSIADKYGVLALKSRAKEKFDRIVKTCWDIDDFAHAITEVYSSTPSTDRGLRDTVIEVARNNISTLLEKKDFRSVLEETVGFAADVTQLMNRNQKRSFVKFVCPSCGEDWEAFPKRSMTYCPCCGHYRSDWDNYAVQ